MKELTVIISIIFLSVTIQAQSETEELFKKHYSEYINNYSPESGNIPRNSTIEEFREQYEKLKTGLLDVDNFIDKADSNLFVFEYRELTELKNNNQIKLLQKLLIDTIDVYKRFLGENSKYGIGKEYLAIMHSKDNKAYTEKDIDIVLQNWRHLFIYFPKSNTSIYSKGDVLFRMKIKETEGEIRESYIDTLLMIYDQRIKYFGGDEKYGSGYLKGKKGQYLCEYRKDSCLEEAYTLLKESVEIQKEETRFTVIKIFYNVGMDMYKLDKINVETLFNNYYKCLNYLTQSTNKYTNILDIPHKSQVEKYKKIIKNNTKVAEYIQASFRHLNPGNCDLLIPGFEQEFDNRKKDVVWLEDISNILEFKDCTENELYYNIIKELSKTKYSPDSLKKRRIDLLSDESYEDAAKYFKIAYILEKDSIKKAEYCYYAAVSEFACNNKPESRRLALLSASYNPKFCKPYVLIAKLYASSAGSCFNSGFEKSTVYWVAVDKLVKAKSINSNYSEEANKVSEEVDRLIEKYTSRFPTHSGFDKISNGHQYNVDCWINEVTIVRFKAE